MLARRVSARVLQQGSQGNAGVNIMEPDEVEERELFWYGDKLRTRAH